MLLGGSFNGINSDFDPGAGTAFLSSAGGYDLFFARYSETITGIENPIATSLMNDMSLHPNSPNPFDLATTIKFDLPLAQFIALRIYDINGQLVTTLLEQQLNAGNHEIQWDAQKQKRGVYICCLESNEKRIFRKLLCE
jgi:hypothetical protein